MQPVTEAQNYTHISSTTTISAALTNSPGGLLGIFCASASGSPTIAVTDGASTTIVNTFTPAGATFYPMPARFVNGLKVTIGGTVDCTVFWST